jgi:hypothetical protein
MSDKKPTKNAPAPEKQMPSNVAAFKSEKCIAEGCKSDPARANFCTEHYTWFKEGLVTMDGYRARYFEKKYHDWLRRTSKVA